MLSAAIVVEIRRLLDEEELSQRAIAEKLKVGRGTVGSVASGERGLHGHAYSQRKWYDGPHAAMAVRCPGCGGMVFLPCLLCRARNFGDVRRWLLTASLPPRPTAETASPQRAA